MGLVLEGTKQAPPCAGGQQIIYAWAKNAPQLTLPEDVGFKVGGRDSKINYLVLQVHYASVANIPETGDRSGVVLTYTDRPQPKRAGVYFLGTSGIIPPQTTTYMEAACSLNTNLVIHPFAFRSVVQSSPVLFYVATEHLSISPSLLQDPHPRAGPGGQWLEGDGGDGVEPHRQGGPSEAPDVLPCGGQWDDPEERRHHRCPVHHGELQGPDHSDRRDC